MEKRLLIVTDYFPPNFAPRMGCLCKFLLESFDITVVAAESPLKTWPIDIDYSKFKLYKISFWQKSKIKNLLLKFLTYAIDYQSRYTYNKVIKDIGNEHFDIVLCATYYHFPLLCGKKLARHFDAPLIIDLRDIFEQWDKPKGLKKISNFCKLRWLNTIRRNKIIRKANAITTVSPWHKDFLSKYNKRTSLIYNGFDKDAYYPKDIKSDKFSIVYLGRWLSPTLQDARLLFDAVEQLISEQQIDCQNFEICFYSDTQSHKLISSETSNYKLLQKVLHIKSLILMSEVPNLLHNSSIALLLTNESTPDGPHGLMPTKFYEYLGVEKPILCVRSDEACLASVIRDTNAGLSATNVADVKSFILEKYAEWQRNGFTHQIVNQEAKNKFSRQAQSQQFAKIINELISEHNK